MKWNRVLSALLAACASASLASAGGFCGVGGGDGGDYYQTPVIHVNGACGDDAWSGLSPLCTAPDGPKRTIQAGVDAGGIYGLVQVADGVYTGPGNRDIVVAAEWLTIRSQSGPGACVIDCQGTPADPHRAFIIAGSQGGMYGYDRLGGFTIRNGYAIDGGGAIVSENNFGAWVDCVFVDNAAESTTPQLGGGAVRVRSGAPHFLNCTFVRNTAQYGGAVQLNGGARISNCVFSANSAFRGGAIHNSGAGFVENCTISGNTATHGGAVFSDSGAPNVGNCILWGNAPNQLDGHMIVWYSTIQGGWPGLGNLDSDPLLVRLPSHGGDGWGDDSSTLEDESANDDFGDLRLGSGSPCIDSGYPQPPSSHRAVDRDGRIRVWDGNADGLAQNDRGAFEFGAPIPADVDGDCAVGLSDLAVLLLHFGAANGAFYADGDLDFDSDVDLYDLTLLLAAFGATCP